MPSNTKIEVKFLKDKYGNYIRDKKGELVVESAYLVDAWDGSVIADIKYSNKDMGYAVVVKGAHCGDGYYIPKIFDVRAKNKDEALKFVLSRSGVQRSRNDAVLFMFKINEFEAGCIRAVNEIDPYHYNHTDSVENLIIRRIPQPKYYMDAGDVKSAEDYPEKYVLERYCAPTVSGNNVIYPHKIDKDKFLRDFVKQAFIENAYKNNCKTRTKLAMNYYQMFGPNNEFGVKLDPNGFVTYTDCNGKLRTCELAKSVLERVLKQGTFEKSEKETPETIVLGKDDKPKISQIDKFNKRFANFVPPTKKKEENEEPAQPGEY